MPECFECGQPRANIKKCETCGSAEFKPCAFEDGDAMFTEIILRDAATVWVPRLGHDLGYDLETGELIAIRVDGLVSTMRVQK